jgi:hypothetical protein
VLTEFAGMEYPQRYAWFLHFDEKGVIYEVSLHLDQIIRPVTGLRFFGWQKLTVSAPGQSIP